MADGDRTSARIEPLRIADALRGVRHVFVRDLICEARIGVWDHEKGNGQRVRINVDLSVTEQAPHGDQLSNVVCYNQVVNGIKTLIKAGHINLVETLAERIADMSLQDHRVVGVRVRVEKLDAFEDAESVGVEIERHKPN